MKFRYLNLQNLCRFYRNSSTITPPSFLIKKETHVPKALYGGRQTVTMLPGGGIGPELMNYVQEVCKYIGAPVDFEIFHINPKIDEGNELEQAVTSIRRNGYAIKANIETISESPLVKSRNVAIRTNLDLYVNVVNCKTFPGIPSIHKDVNITVIRQNTEGEYALLEHESVAGVVEHLKFVTRTNTERIASFAFEYARKYKRKKVTTVHKADIMILCDGLFLDVTRKIAKEYPDIKHDDMTIDNCCLKLVTNPQYFDVIVTPNLYGSVITNCICGLIGGPGMTSGRNYGDYYAIFETGTRNIGNEIAGKNIANPTAIMRATIDMLNHLNYTKYANLIDKALMKALMQDNIRTPDIGGTNSSTDVIDSMMDFFQHNITSIF